MIYKSKIPWRVQSSPAQQSDSHEVSTTCNFGRNKSRQGLVPSNSGRRRLFGTLKKTQREARKYCHYTGRRPNREPGGSHATVARAYFQFPLAACPNPEIHSTLCSVVVLPAALGIVTLELLGTEGRWFHLSVMVVFQGVCRTRHAWPCGLARDNRG